jgi:tRNA(Ile)-lysidine synthase TilS/MesJ
MVLAKLLPKLREKHGSFRVVAVHIDYANRPESADEARFVEAWCLERGIEFTQLRINAIKRGITGREEYEVESRKIRYDLYRETMERTGAPAMLVGHHRGDVQENIISNMFKVWLVFKVRTLSPTLSRCGSLECTRQRRDLLVIYFTGSLWDPLSLEGPGSIRNSD